MCDTLACFLGLNNENPLSKHSLVEGKLYFYMFYVFRLIYLVHQNQLPIPKKTNPNFQKNFDEIEQVLQVLFFGQRFCENLGFASELVIRSDEQDHLFAILFIWHTYVTLF